MKKLLKISEQATSNASRALSKLISRPVSVEIINVQVIKAEGLSSIIEPKDKVVAIHLPITGDVLGAALLTFQKETALALYDLLEKRDPGKTRRLTEQHAPPLKELGDIICSNCIAILSNVLQVNMIAHRPSFTFDSFRSLLGRIITRYARNTEKALVMEMELIIKPVVLKGYFLLLFEREDTREILDLLGSNQ